MHSCYGKFHHDWYGGKKIKMTFYLLHNEQKCKGKENAATTQLYALYSYKIEFKNRHQKAGAFGSGFVFG